MYMRLMGCGTWSQCAGLAMLLTDFHAQVCREPCCVIAGLYSSLLQAATRAKGDICSGFSHGNAIVKIEHVNIVCI